jgi:hypothetical protein
MSWREKSEHQAHQRGIIEQAQHVAMRQYQTYMRLLAYRWFAPVTALGLFAYHKSGPRLEKAKAVHAWMRNKVFGFPQGQGSGQVPAQPSRRRCPLAPPRTTRYALYCE